MSSDTDALTRLCAAERDAEVPPPGSEQAGWDRLERALWPGGGEGGGGDGSGAGETTGSPPTTTAAQTATGVATGMKIAVALALATAVAGGIGLATWPDTDAPRTELAAAVPSDAPGDAARTALADDPPRAPEPSARPETTEPPLEPPSPEPTADASDRPAQGDTGPGATEPAPARAGSRAAALPDVPGEGLAHEVAILREASAALAAGKPRTALRWVRRHAADHPDGSLTEERLATEAIARCQLRDAGAAALAERFVQRYPRSTHERRVRAACETMTP